MGGYVLVYFFIECEALGLTLNEKKKHLLKYLHHS